MRRRLGKLQKFVVAAALVIGYSLLFAAPAGAEDLVPTVSNSIQVNGERVFSVPMATWDLFASVFLPFAVMLLTKVGGRSGVKIVIQFILSAATGLVGTAVVADGVAVLSSTSIVNVGMTVFLSTIAYMGWYKKTNVAGALPLSNKGFG